MDVNKHTCSVQTPVAQFTTLHSTEAFPVLSKIIYLGVWVEGFRRGRRLNLKSN